LCAGTWPSRQDGTVRFEKTTYCEWRATMRNVTVVFERGEQGWWVATYPEIPGTA